jgi:hypothetical protein
MPNITAVAAELTKLDVIAMRVTSVLEDQDKLVLATIQ